jgi:hypothetical protein
MNQKCRRVEAGSGGQKAQGNGKSSQGNENAKPLLTTTKPPEMMSGGAPATAAAVAALTPAAVAAVTGASAPAEMDEAALGDMHEHSLSHAQLQRQEQQRIALEKKGQLICLYILNYMSIYDLYI